MPSCSGYRRWLKLAKMSIRTDECYRTSAYWLFGKFSSYPRSFAPLPIYRYINAQFGPIFVLSLGMRRHVGHRASAFLFGQPRRCRSNNRHDRYYLMVSLQRETVVLNRKIKLFDLRAQMERLFCLAMILLSSLSSPIKETKGQR